MLQVDKLFVGMLWLLYLVFLIFYLILHDDKMSCTTHKFVADAQQNHFI